MEMRWTTHQKFRPYDLRTPYFSEWFTPEALAELREFWASVSRLYLIVVPDPPKESRDKSELKPGVPPPGWVKDQQKSIKKQLKEAGAKAKRGADAGPDRGLAKRNHRAMVDDRHGQFGCRGQRKILRSHSLARGRAAGAADGSGQGGDPEGICETCRASGRETHRAGPQVGARSQERAVARAAAPAQAGARQRGFSRSADARCRPPRRGALEEAGALPPAPAAAPGARPRRKSICRSGSTPGRATNGSSASAAPHPGRFSPGRNPAIWSRRCARWPPSCEPKSASSPTLAAARAAQPRGRRSEARSPPSICRPTT